jgi:choline dehydrogenase-like flavoprotein
MLSGIGPAEELARHGISVRVDSSGVGANLQDCYEVGVVSRIRSDWLTQRRTRIGLGRASSTKWYPRRVEVYPINVAAAGITRPSEPPMRPLPDLFTFALLGKRGGYDPGPSKPLVESHSYLTRALVKARTNNTAGSVRLRSADPRDTPLIHFRYFDEGNDRSQHDLESVVSGIELLRDMNAKLGSLIEEEELPGKQVRSREQLRQFVRDHAWGQHASCTCRIGTASDRMAVIDSRFRVHGVQGLRVVDASVFPRMPGFFIVSAIYMVSEKAADAILEDRRRAEASAGVRPSRLDARELQTESI